LPPTKQTPEAAAAAAAAAATAAAAAVTVRRALNSKYRRERRDIAREQPKRLRAGRTMGESRGRGGV